MSEFAQHLSRHGVQARLIIDGDNGDMPAMSGETDLHDSGSNSITILAYTRPADRTQPTARDRFAISSARGGSGHRKEQEMKAIRCREWGTPDVLRLEEAESPSLKPHQVRIRVRAAGVNFADSLMVGGTYQVKPPFPFTPGLEAAGEIIETGDGEPSLRTGQRVLGVLRNGGGYAEEIVLDAATVLPIPETMDFVTAAAFPVAYGTSHFSLTHRGQLQSGETLLVLGAAGGVGLTAVEIGKARGAHVIAAAGGADKLAVARSRGADELIDYRSESLRDRVRELTGGKGADVVYDPVGGDAFDQALRAVNWEARMMVIGFASGRVQAVPANLILVKNISVIGVVWGAQTERHPAWMSRSLAELLRWWEDGKLKPLIAKTFSLAEAGLALDALVSRRYAGKVVLKV